MGSIHTLRGCSFKLLRDMLVNDDLFALTRFHTDAFKSYVYYLKYENNREREFVVLISNMIDQPTIG